MLGESRTTRAGFRGVADFRRPVFIRLLEFGDSTGSTGDVDCEWLCIMCGLAILLRWGRALSAGEVNGLK